MRFGIVLGMSFLAIASPLVATADEAPRPNIVLLLCDDLGYGDLACFANPTVRTPHLDRLAASGLKLTHGYSASPVCSPSRAGLMTGRSPNRLGIFDWIPENSGVFLRPGEVTIAQRLRQSGYRTCHVGKWHLNSRTDGTEPSPGDAGFDHWLYTQNNASPGHMNPVNFVRNGKPAGPLAGPSSHILADEATRWLDQQSNRPFFLNVWFHEPHEPIVASAEFLALYPDETNPDRRHHLGDISQMDAAVGKILAYLDQHGLTENTIVVFTSDNGPETLNRYKGAERSYGTPGPLRGMKLHVTEAGYRVPWLIRWPGHTRPGTVSDEPVCSLDLLPTFCALAGVDPPAGRDLDGQSLLPVLEGKPIVRSRPLYWQYDRAISRPWTIALRDGPWKLLANATMDQFRLYRLDRDPSESHDLAGDHPERVQAMAALMSSRHQQVARDAAASGNPLPLPPPAR